MWLVKRYSLQKVREIAPRIKEALTRHFIENREITSALQREIAAILQEARENEFWIACDCLQDAPEPPLMYARGLKSGRLSLVRMSNRAAHFSTCPLKRMEEDGECATTASSRTKPWDSTLPLNLHRGLVTELSSAQAQKNKAGSSSSTRLSKLGRLLYTVLQDSGLTKMDIHAKSVNEQYAALRKVASGYALATQIAAKDYLWTFAKDVNRAYQTLKTNAASWPATTRPYGLALLTVDHFDGQKAVCAQENKEEISIALQGNLSFSSGRIGEASKPFLLLCTITDLTGKPGYYQPMNGYAIPVYSKALLMPVESNYERRVLKKLIEIVRALHNKNVFVAVEKPLFDVEVTVDGEIVQCRPDFLLETNKRKVVIEVMGSHEDDYLSRKARTHPVMEKLGTLLTFDAQEAERTKQWDAKLDKLVKQIYAVLLS